VRLEAWADHFPVKITLDVDGGLCRNSIMGFYAGNLGVFQRRDPNGMKKGGDIF
jgi:hypothetical protein